ncbi:Uncharacterised protein [Mycobacteroides abscessus subsp. abscessus]|nr:Uncharacterised protein [Mycobacteroides abscessus subsp. abscessus]
MCDVASAARLGDRKAADLLAGERRPHPSVDLVGIAGGDQVRQRDSVREQGGEDARGTTRIVELFAQDRRIDEIATTTTERFVDPQSEEAEFGCFGV